MYQQNNTASLTLITNPTDTTNNIYAIQQLELQVESLVPSLSLDIPPLTKEYDLKKKSSVNLSVTLIMKSQSKNYLTLEHVCVMVQNLWVTNYAKTTSTI